ncbi:MAG: GAF domain-containing protein [Bacteroidetes bacterium]|nr:GAF domain-containing protein [Bacteroidota bacterium]
MVESILISSDLSKAERYNQVLSQLKIIVGAETNSTAILSIVTGALHEVFNNLWTGFYIVDGDSLVLGPYQGPLACLRIAYGKGVCGLAWESKSTQIVGDVNQFPGHIVCNSESKSEIVVPVLGKNGRVIAVFDLDSDKFASYDEVDAKGLSQITTWLGEKL